MDTLRSKAESKRGGDDARDPPDEVHDRKATDRSHADGGGADGSRTDVSRAADDGDAAPRREPGSSDSERDRSDVRPSRSLDDPTAETTPSPVLGLPDSRPSPAARRPSARIPSSRPGCPPEHEIQAFLEGRVSRERHADLNAHLDACGDCFELVSALARSSTSDSDNLPDSFAYVWPTTIARGAVLAERFDVLRFVAKGGMGEVYEAYDRNLEERVALKTMLCTAPTTDAALEQLRDEVRLSRRIAHRNVCRIHELHVHRSAREGAAVQFVSMEFVDGETLKQRLADGPLPLAEVVGVGRQLLEGLGAAHASDVLHLDFKSQNVLLRAEADPPEPVIMDFGLARTFDVEERLRTSERHVAGSAGYMSPEQIQCHPAGPRSDLYAFGVVLFEMLTGRMPFEGDSAAAVMMKQLKQRAPAPSRVRPELPGAFDALVARCLSRDPRQRPESVAATRAAFEDAVRQIDAPPGPRRTARWAAWTALAGALALATSAWLLDHSGTSPATDDAPRDADDHDEPAGARSPSPRVERRPLAPPPEADGTGDRQPPEPGSPQKRTAPPPTPSAPTLEAPPARASSRAKTTFERIAPAKAPARADEGVGEAGSGAGRFAGAPPQPGSAKSAADHSAADHSAADHSAADHSAAERAPPPTDPAPSRPGAAGESSETSGPAPNPPPNAAPAPAKSKSASKPKPKPKPAPAKPGPDRRPLPDWAHKVPRTLN